MKLPKKLHVSERTVEKHRSNIIAKLNLSGQANSLSLWAVEQKSCYNEYLEFQGALVRAAEKVLLPTKT